MVLVVLVVLWLDSGKNSGSEGWFGNVMVVKYGWLW